VVKADARKQPERLVDVGLRKFPYEALPEANIARRPLRTFSITVSRRPTRIPEDHSHTPARAAH
jgi:hypothetical protein